MAVFYLRQKHVISQSIYGVLYLKQTALFTTAAWPVGPCRLVGQCQSGYCQGARITVRGGRQAKVAGSRERRGGSGGGVDVGEWYRLLDIVWLASCLISLFVYRVIVWIKWWKVDC